MTHEAPIRREVTRSRAPWPRWVAIGPLAVLTSIFFVTAGVQAQSLQVGPLIRVDTGGSAAANETSSMSDPLGGDVIVSAWNDWRLAGPGVASRIGVGISFDAGSTWSDQILVAPPAITATNESDPMLAADPRTGNIWIGGVAFSGGIFVARKGPADSTFNPSVIAVEDNFADKPFMTAGPVPGDPDSTRLYVASNLGLTYSDDLGQSWSSVTPLAFGSGFIPRIGPSGALYIAYWDAQDRHRLLRSDDGGQTFVDRFIATRMDPWTGSDGTRFPGRFRVAPLPYLAVSPVDESLVCFYFDTTQVVSGIADVDLYFTRSIDGGDTWSVPTVPSGIRTSGDQFFSWVEFDEEGRLHVVYLDSGNTPQPDDQPGGWLDAYYGVSADDGASWTSVRLTEESWSSADDGLALSSEFIGDYIGLSVSGQDLHAVFPAAAGGDPDIYTRTITLATGDLFVRGDCNADGDTDAADASWLLSVLFIDQSPAALACPKSCDGNDDGLLDVADAVTLLTFVFAGGAPLSQPGPDCGSDPTPDALLCSSYTVCP